jgi:DNA-binding NtrC family response regulator
MPVIAVVPSSDTLLSLVHEMIGDQSWEIVSLPNGERAIQALAKSPPDVILIDIERELTTHVWQVLEQSHCWRVKHSIPIVVWTSDIDGISSRQEWLREQHISVLQKPFELEDLYAMLAGALNKGRNVDLHSQELLASASQRATIGNRE